MTHYLLILVTVILNKPHAEILSVDITMNDCFIQRDKIVRMYNLPRAGVQAICLRME